MAPVSPGLLTVPLPLVLVSPMYVPGTTDQVPRNHNPVIYLYLGSLEALYDLLPEPPVSTEIDKKRRTLGKLFWPEKSFSPEIFSGGTVDIDDEKILSTCSWPKFFHYTLFGRETSLLQGEHPIFMGKQTFHERDTVFNSFANCLSWRARKLRSLERSFPTQN